MNPNLQINTELDNLLVLLLMLWIRLFRVFLRGFEGINVRPHKSHKVPQTHSSSERRVDPRGKLGRSQDFPGRRIKSSTAYILVHTVSQLAYMRVVDGGEKFRVLLCCVNIGVM